MSEFRLPDAQVRYYQENGFIQFNDVLTPAEVEQARASLAEAMQMRLQGGIDRTGNPEYDRIFLQKVNLWRDHPGMRAVVFHPRLAEIARQLAGVPRLRLWHDHALIKLPSDSKPSHWHQDLPYWPMNEPGALSCWLALDDVDERNGCMHFVPRSHTWWSRKISSHWCRSQRVKTSPRCRCRCAPEAAPSTTASPSTTPRQTVGRHPGVPW
jgi:ectoine hydroxylase-related dioxygenase (phytanoyl-CoA dioxygenase family)